MKKIIVVLLFLSSCSTNIASYGEIELRRNEWFLKNKSSSQIIVFTIKQYKENTNKSFDKKTDSVPVETNTKIIHLYPGQEIKIGNRKDSLIPTDIYSKNGEYFPKDEYFVSRFEITGAIEKKL